MPDINTKLSNIVDRAWTQPEEQTIANYINKNKDAIIQNPAGAKQFISQLQADNKDLLMSCSQEFTNLLNDLSSDIMESREKFALVKSVDRNGKDCIKTVKVDFLQEEYSMDWMSTVNIRIHNRHDTPFSQEIAKTITNLLRNKKYNVTSKITGRTDGTSIKEIYVTDFPMTRLIQISKDLKKINNELQCDPYTKGTYINKNKNEMNDENNETHKWDITENNTADMAVMDKPAFGKELVRKRLEDFDPYANALNVKSGSKTVTKLPLQELKEKLIGIKGLERSFVMEHNLSTSGEHAKAVLIHEDGETNLEFSKSDFESFVEKNVSRDGKKATFERFISEQTDAKVQLLLKEYFKSLITEDMGLKIDDVKFDFDKVIIEYYYPRDRKTTSLVVPFNEFEQFCESIDPNYDEYIYKDRSAGGLGFEMRHNFDSYWDNIPSKEQNELVMRFVEKKGIKTEAKSTIKNKSVYRDYNIWKESVATKTGNNFDITVSQGNFIAKEGKKIVGGWNSKLRGGFIYK